MCSILSVLCQSHAIERALFIGLSMVAFITTNLEPKNRTPYLIISRETNFRTKDHMKHFSLDDTQIGHSQRLFVTKFDPVDKFSVMSAGWDSSVKLWDTRTNNVVWNVTGM